MSAEITATEFVVFYNDLNPVISLVSHLTCVLLRRVGVDPVLLCVPLPPPVLSLEGLQGGGAHRKGLLHRGRPAHALPRVPAQRPLPRVPTAPPPPAALQPELLQRPERGPAAHPAAAGTGWGITMATVRYGCDITFKYGCDIFLLHLLIQ